MKYKILVIIIFPLSEIVAKQFIVAILISKFVFVSQIKFSSTLITHTPPRPYIHPSPPTPYRPKHTSTYTQKVFVYILYIWAENDKLNCIFALF